MPGRVWEDPDLRDRTLVFTDRKDAGSRLGAFLRDTIAPQDPVVCAIPAGGVPVGVMAAGLLGCPLVTAVVRKVRVPGNPEAGIGAVTWDGRVMLNRPLIARLGLTDREVDAAVAETMENVRHRVARFAPDRDIALDGRTAIAVDDGLASGYTMRAAVAAIRAAGPAVCLVAVPTGSRHAVEALASEADGVISLNIRSGPVFAVADAYEHWHDLTDEEVAAWLDRLTPPGEPESGR
ncbi:MAG: phosphoribosyltransferase [Methanomicrobiales archaeon]